MMLHTKYKALVKKILMYGRQNSVWDSNLTKTVKWNHPMIIPVMFGSKLPSCLGGDVVLLHIVDGQIGGQNDDGRWRTSEDHKNSP